MKTHKNMSTTFFYQRKWAKYEYEHLVNVKIMKLVTLLSILILSRSFCVRKTNIHVYRGTNIHSIFKTLYHTEEQLFYQNIVYRKLGKKMTSNFLARYLYGNGYKKGLQNFHLNIRSLKNKVHEIKNIIERDSPQVFGLSEVELTKENTDTSKLKIQGYDLIFPKSWDIYGEARVVVYVKKTFKYERLHQLEDNSIQSIWIRGKQKYSKNILFCHFYREHLSTQSTNFQNSYFDTFLSQWEAALEYENVTEDNEVHICGDMNLDSLNGKWLEPTYKLVSLSRLIKKIL